VHLWLEFVKARSWSTVHCFGTTAIPMQFGNEEVCCFSKRISSTYGDCGKS
jgi:hypothetical protein